MRWSVIGISRCHLWYNWPWYNLCYSIYRMCLGCKYINGRSVIRVSKTQLMKTGTDWNLCSQIIMFCKLNYLKLWLLSFCFHAYCSIIVRHLSFDQPGKYFVQITVWYLLCMEQNWYTNVNISLLKPDSSIFISICTFYNDDLGNLWNI